MLPFPTLPPPEHDYYSAFYLLGFGVAGGLLLCAGARRGYPWRTWLLLVAGVLLLLIVGTKLAAGSTTDWQQLLAHGHWRGSGGRSIVGGLAGAVVALAALRRWLGFGRDVYDAFALPLVLGLATQGIGCLLTGCCFGTPASAGPGLHYAAGTLPFAAHVAAGLVAPDAAHSLPVHPAQLYQIVLCLILAGALHATRHRPWPAGVRFWLTLGGYVAGRFALEFTRDAAGDVLGSGYWLGLKPVQWLLLAAAAGLAGLLWARFRAPRPLSSPRTATSSSRSLLLMVGLLVLAAAPGPGRLALAEVWVVKSLLLVALGLEVRHLLFAHGRFRLTARLSLGLAVVAAFTMSQTPAPTPEPPAESLRRYTTVSAGGMLGGSEQHFYYPYIGCSGTPTRASTYRQQFRVASLGLTRTLPAGHAGTFTLGLTAGFGESRFQSNQDSVYFPGTNSTTNLAPFIGGRARLYSFSPYFELAHPKYFRFGLGAHLGDVAYDYVYKPGEFSSARIQMLVEGGRFNTLFAHISVNHGLLGMGNGLIAIGLGSGFGSFRSRLVAGAAFANSETNGAKMLDRTEDKPFPFLQGTLAISARWQLQPFAATNLGNIYQFRLQTQYRLPGRAR